MLGENPTVLHPDPWTEYDRAAEWCAKHHPDLAVRGHARDGDLPLPANLSPEARALIEDDPEAFAARVRSTAYALAMSGTPEE